MSDVNEYPPRFTSDSVRVSLEEGEMRENIVTLRAKDDDCGEQFGRVCRYYIETENQPFEISDKGKHNRRRPRLSFCLTYGSAVPAFANLSNFGAKRTR